MSRVVALVGATATGKSAVALAVAEACGAEIVNADALQVYRGLDIGTAKPDAAERARVPHHLIDILEPGERFSAGEFARRATVALGAIAARGRPTVVVGGSGLYLRALWGGLAPIPAVDASVRAALDARLAAEGLPALRAELARRDPATAARLGEGDTQRILRALEVALGTGRALSSWHAEQRLADAPPALRKIGLTLPRTVLYDRIAERVRLMVDRGWPEEVRRLLVAGVPREAPALQAIGYSDWIRYFDGESDLRATVEAIVRATRRYAKRQETWFRREADVSWRDAGDVDTLARELAQSMQGEAG